MKEHIPHIKDDQDSPYWTVTCSCKWRSGACTQLDAAVESYGEHIIHTVLVVVTQLKEEI
jgi:hypothetical protein